MKKLFTIAAALLLSLGLHAQDWASLYRFEDADAALAAQPQKKRVVLMGDSITDCWVMKDPEFFQRTGFISRGFSGQTTPQMLIRFRRDVLSVGASTVVILAGTNDIAGNTGFSTPEMVLDNIAGMCDIARQHGIRPVICSILPAHAYPWTKDERCQPEVRIPRTNALLAEYAKKNKITYVDYFSALADTQDPENVNGLPKALSPDGVHPNKDGYVIMEEVLLKALKKEAAAFKAPAGPVFMSYNVRNGLGMDNRCLYYRPAAIIADQHPDVVAIQELDRKTGRSNGADVIGELAWRTGLKGTFARAIDHNGGEYGVGMLSVKEPLRTGIVPLPGREEKRVLLMAEFEDYIFCCTHLSLTAEDRMASIDIIVSSISGFSANCAKPVYIAGDWNDTPDSEVLAKIQENFTILTDTSALTFPADKPERCIDYIALWKGNGLGDAKPAYIRVPAAALASDHRPVVVAF